MLRKELRDRHLIGLIADTDMATGMILAGIANSTNNYFIVDSKTPTSAIEETFINFTTNRRDMAIVLITQQVADRIRRVVDAYEAILPALLEIPSRDCPYDEDKDSVLKRINRLCTNE